MQPQWGEQQNQQKSMLNDVKTSMLRHGVKLQQQRRQQQRQLQQQW